MARRGAARRTALPALAAAGKDLVAKVLQQASSRTLPDVLMIDNPDLQQIAATGALAPVGDFGLSADGYQQGVASASTYDGKVYGLQPITNSIGLFYNVDILAKAGITPPKTWDELKTAAAALTQGQQYASRSTRPPTTRAPGSSCRSCGPTAATRPTSRPRRPRRSCSCGSTW